MSIVNILSVYLLIIISIFLSSNQCPYQSITGSAIFQFITYCPSLYNIFVPGQTNFEISVLIWHRNLGLVINNNISSSNNNDKFSNIMIRSIHSSNSNWDIISKDSFQCSSFPTSWGSHFGTPSRVLIIETEKIFPDIFQRFLIRPKAGDWNAISLFWFNSTLYS